jgi:hypothetical protein
VVKNLFIMNVIHAGSHTESDSTLFRRELTILSTIRKWIGDREPDWEDARITISGVGIFIQVTLAGIMIGFISAAGAPPLVYSVGIFFAFIADSIAFGQAPMRWVIGLFVLSSLVNILLVIYYAIQMIIH